MLEEIKKNLKSENLVIGTERTVKLLRIGKIKKIAVASNVSDKTRKDLEYYSKITGAEISVLKIPNEELGTVCKKPYSISVIGLL